MTKPDGARALQVWEDCVRPSPDDLDTCNTPGKMRGGTDAFGFVLKDSDHVLLVLIGQVADNQRLDAQFAVTGTKVDDKAREGLKKVFAAPQTKEAAAGRAGGTSGSKVSTTIVPVTDDLIAGGRITVTFKKYERTGDKEGIVDSPEPVVFKIARRNPWFMFSYGLALTKGPTASVEIIKTRNILTFVKDGKTQQAFESAIHLKDNDDALRPIETAVAFLNFRLRPEWLYGSLGFPANDTVFTQPLLGVSVRIPLGSTLGMVVSTGIRFTQETEIAAESGFTNGQTLDPTVGLTVGDIPTTSVRHERRFFSISFDF